MEKQRWEEFGRRSQEVRRSEKRKSETQEDAGARKRRKVTIHSGFFQWFVAPEGRQVTSLKRRVRSHASARWEMKNCTRLWREARFQVKMYKAHQRLSTFGSANVEEVHAVVARSTFPGQKCQEPTVSDHFWKLRYRKSARRCGAKGISKSKVSKMTCSDHFLAFRCRKSGCRRCAKHVPKSKVLKLTGSDHFLTFTGRQSARCCGAKHISKSKVSKTEGFGPLFDVQRLQKWTLTNLTNLTNTTKLTNKQTN